MEVTEKIFNQYRKVQQAGPENMGNKNAIQRYAYEQEYYELVTFIEDGDYYEELLMNYDKYAQMWPEE
jgi:hypothetical protein